VQNLLKNLFFDMNIRFLAKRCNPAPEDI